MGDFEEFGEERPSSMLVKDRTYLFAVLDGFGTKETEVINGRLKAIFVTSLDPLTRLTISSEVQGLILQETFIGEPDVVRHYYPRVQLTMGEEAEKATFGTADYFLNEKLKFDVEAGKVADVQIVVRYV